MGRGFGGEGPRRLREQTQWVGVCHTRGQGLSQALGILRL